MVTAAYLAALNLVRIATPDELRSYQDQRRLELALQSIGISGDDLDADEMQMLREEIRNSLRMS
jgi:hypothetical protein